MNGTDIMWNERTVRMSELRQLLEANDVEIDSPDGWVPVTAFVDKGEWDEYLAYSDAGRVVRVNAAHLFDTVNGWMSAESMVGRKTLVFCDDGAYHHVVVVPTGQRIPIVDIQVDHSNHRYYANGLSSHNTNVGKSLFLVHMASACLRQNKNVLYITLEMAEERIAERIDANMMNLPIDDVNLLSRSDYIRKIINLKQSSTGRLIIKEYPTGSAHCGHFRALLQELKLKQNFTPDIIFVDYISICASSRVKMGSTVNSYTLYKFVAEELRGLAVEADVPVFSAAQFNRQGYDSSDPSMSNVGESWAIPQTADFMFALVTNEDLEKLGQIQVQPMKNRYAKRNSFQHSLIGIDTERMKLYDLAPSQITASQYAGLGNPTSPPVASRPSKLSFGSRRHNKPLSSFGKPEDSDNE